MSSETNAAVGAASEKGINQVGADQAVNANDGWLLDDFRSAMCFSPRPRSSIARSARQAS